MRTVLGERALGIRPSKRIGGDDRLQGRAGTLIFYRFCRRRTCSQSGAFPLAGASLLDFGSLKKGGMFLQVLDLWLGKHPITGSAVAAVEEVSRRCTSDWRLLAWVITHHVLQGGWVWVVNCLVRILPHLIPQSEAWNWPLYEFFCLYLRLRTMSPTYAAQLLVSGVRYEFVSVVGCDLFPPPGCDYSEGTA